MAGILDEVMDGIAAKKEEEGKTPTPDTKPAGENPMNTYSDQFKEKYGDKSGVKK